MNQLFNGSLRDHWIHNLQDKKASILSSGRVNSKGSTFNTFLFYYFRIHQFHILFLYNNYLMFNLIYIQPYNFRNELSLQGKFYKEIYKFSTFCSKQYILQDKLIYKPHYARFQNYRCRHFQKVENQKGIFLCKNLELERVMDYCIKHKHQNLCILCNLIHSLNMKLLRDYKRILLCNYLCIYLQI